jgi:hypothetical protein
MTPNMTEIKKVAFNNGIAAQDSFRSLYSNLIASFSSSEVADSIGAHIRLELSEEVMNTPPSYDLYLSLMERSFLALYDRSVIQPNAPITGRGENELQSMRQRTGIGYEPPATQEEIAQSAEQELEQQVLSDWKNLPSAAVKAKIAGNKNYRAAFDRLSLTDAIGGTSTTFSRIEGAPDGNQYGRQR